MMAENTDNNVPEQPRQSMDYSHSFSAKIPSVQREASISDDSEIYCTRHECETIKGAGSQVTELENVDMMAENTTINISKKHRQSKDYTHNFNAKNPIVQREASISNDSEIYCTRHECVLTKKNSTSSIRSLDSGYGSIKRGSIKRVFSISENDEESKQTDINFK